MQRTQPRRVFRGLEELLGEARCLSPDGIFAVRQFQSENGVNFGTAVMFLRLVETAVIAELLARYAGIRSVRASDLQISAGVKNLLPVEHAKALQLFPLGIINDSGSKIGILGMTDPLDQDAIARAQLTIGIAVQPAFLPLSDLQALYKKYYRSSLALFPSEPTSAGEKTVNRRIDSLLKEAAAPHGKGAPGMEAVTSVEVRALVRALIERGLLTEAEFLRALRLEET